MRRRFHANSYPSKMIRKYFSDRPQASTNSQDMNKQISYLKLSYYREKCKHKILTLTRQYDLIEKMRIILKTETSFPYAFEREKILHNALKYAGFGLPVLLRRKTTPALWNFLFTNSYKLYAKIFGKKYNGRTAHTIRVVYELCELCKKHASAFHQ